MTKLIPASAIVPTRNRTAPMRRMLESLSRQSAQPAEMVVVDGSDDAGTEELCRSSVPGLLTRIVYHRAAELGAAAQRNQAVAHATQEAVIFFDDDIVFEAECVERLWAAFTGDPAVGGASSMITNQRYLPPGRVSQVFFRLLHGRAEESYAGKCIGPAYGMLPEDRDDLPEVVPVEWLNLGCTAYRRDALPRPVFSSHFTGYSLAEDVTLSLIVGRKWKLVNARTARIFHDSQPGDHKSDVGELARMELVNRHYVMTKVMGRTRPADYLRLLLHQAFVLAAVTAARKNWRELPRVLRGKLRGLREIRSGSRGAAAPVALHKSLPH